MNRRTQDHLITRLRRDADRICLRFGLRYRSIEPERANVKRRYGICYDDGSIKIRLRHAATGEALKYSSLVNTLCHELAHLKHFNHGPQFKAFYARLLAWARYEGIYRPGPAPMPRSEHVEARTRPATSELPIFAATWGAAATARRAPKRPSSSSPPRRPERTAPIQLDLFA